MSRRARTRHGPCPTARAQVYRATAPPAAQRTSRPVAVGLSGPSLNSVQRKVLPQLSLRVQDELACHPAFTEAPQKPPGLGEGNGLRRGRVYLVANPSPDVGQ